MYGDTRRSKRRHDNQRIINKRLKFLKGQDIPGLPSYYEHMKKTPGKLRKHHPFSCNCDVCSSEKYNRNNHKIDLTNYEEDDIVY